MKILHVSFIAGFMLIGTILVSGCVSTKKYNELNQEMKTLKYWAIVTNERVNNLDIKTDKIIKEQKGKYTSKKYKWE